MRTAISSPRPLLARVAAVSGLAAMLAAPLAGQSDATLGGVVTDPQGRVVGGVEIRLTLAGTAAVRSAFTDAEGRYRVAALAPGVYAISVAHGGFRPVEAAGIELHSGRAGSYDIELELGEGREAIEVVAELPLVSTNATDWGGLVPQASLRELPLNGRDLYELSALEPGATLPASARTGLAQGIGRQVSVLGARPNQNSFQLDGVYVNDAASASPASAAGNVLGLEMVREVHLVTSPYSAEYGRTAGGVFTAVSRSGGPRLHGGLYEYFRNNSLDARNFFDAHGGGAPPLRRNQAGALVGGPLSEGKAFFLANYETLRERRTRTARPAVPTQEARTGRLPDSEIAVAAEVRPYLDLYPLPNGRDFGDGTAASVRQLSDRTNETYVSGKVDLILGEAAQWSARYTFDDAESRAPDAMALWMFGLDSNDHFLHTQYKRVHSATTLSTWRAAFSRVDNFENSTTTVPGDLSFVAGLPMGSITVNGLGNMGGFQARARPRRFILESYQLGASLVRSSGHSTWRVGGGFDRVRFNQRSDLSAVGSYTFDSLALLLQAWPRIAEVMQPGSDTVRGWRYNQYSGYVQYEFRPRERLSLSLGARYEAVSTPTEVNGKVAVLRDFVNDAETTVGGPLWRNPSADNLAPRVSMAWDPVGDGRTVLRAGGGIFFDLLGSRELTIAGVPDAAALQSHPRVRAPALPGHPTGGGGQEPFVLDGRPGLQPEPAVRGAMAGESRARDRSRHHDPGRIQRGRAAFT